MKKSKFLQSSKDMLHRSFKPDKCKTSLRLVTSRSKLMRNKKEVQVKQLRREIAHLLESAQDSSARIKVEHVVREEKMMAAYELISLYSELVMTRLTIIESQKNCPIDLKEAITSLIFASPRCGDIPELVDVQKHFTAKYGKEFVTTAIELRPDCGVSRLLVEKLSAKAPDGQTKLKILTAIAEEHSIKWDPKSFGENDLTATTDFLSGPASFQAAAEHIQSPQNQPPQTPQTFQASVVHAQSPRQEPSEVSQNQVHYQPLNPEHNDRFSQGTQNINSTNSEGRPMQSYSQHEATRHFGPGVTTERPAGEQSFSEDRNTFSLHGHNWNMDFKDAASAAQAAAQSADRASMAARAAAEFASRDSMKESHKSGSHSKRDSSEFAEFQKHSSDSYAFDRHRRSDSDQLQGVNSKNPGGSPERSYQGGYDTMANYNRGNNLSSNDSVVDGSSGPSSLDARKYSKKSTYEEEAAKPDTIAKPQYNESEYRSDVREGSDYEDFHNIQSVNFQTNMYKEGAATPENFSNPQYDEPDDISNSEKFHHIQAVNSVKGSGTSLNLQPNIYDENSDASDFDHLSFRSHTGSDSQFGMEQGRIHTDISRTGSGNSASAVFDKAGSEHDDISFDTGPKYDDQDSDSDSIPSGKAAPSNIFRTPSPQDFGFDGSKSPEKSVFQQSSSPGKSSNESPVISETSVNDSKFDDHLPTKFDESDCPSSEGENSVDEVSHTSRKYLETFSGSKGKIIPSPRSSFKEQGNQGVAEKPHLKSTLDESDDEILTQTSSELGNTLNFGNLTGGLRHKQYALPQYINAQVDDVSSSLKNPVEASISKMLESTASITAQGQVNTEVKQVTNNRKTLGLSHDDSDIDSSEDELPAQGSGFGREPYKQLAVKDTGTNSRSKVSVPYFESDSDAVPQSSKQTGRKDKSSGLSRRTQGTPSRTPKVQPKRGERKSSDFSSGIKSAFGSYDPRSTDEQESRRRKDTPSSPVTNKLQSKRDEPDDSEYRSVGSGFCEEPESEQTRATSPGNPNVQPRLKGTNDSDLNSGRKSTFSSSGTHFTENTESPRRNSGRPRNSEQSRSARKSWEQNLEKVSSNQENPISTVAEHSNIFQQKENAPKTSQASQLTGNAPSKLDSSKQPSHVHPKLPDYDTFAAFFKK